MYVFFKNNMVYIIYIYIREYIYITSIDLVKIIYIMHYDTYNTKSKIIIT